jgi:cell division protein FtsQ
VVFIYSPRIAAIYRLLSNRKMRDTGKIIAGPRPYGRGKEKVQQVQFPEQKQARQRSFLKLSLAVLFISLFVLGGVKLLNPQTFPIQSVRIQGDYPHVDHALLRRTVLPFLHSSFLTMDAAGLQERLQQLPWVYQVKVKRVWPGTLLITLQEQKPVARFNDQLLNTQGDLFGADSSTFSADLPLFIGADGQQEVLLQMYNQLLPILAPLHLTISMLALDARQSWQLKMSNGVILLIGTTNPVERLQRFVNVYHQVMRENPGLVKYIDLRYAHGLAVKYTL